MINKLWDKFVEESEETEEVFSKVTKEAFFAGAVKMWQLLEQKSQQLLLVEEEADKVLHELVILDNEKPKVN